MEIDSELVETLTSRERDVLRAMSAGYRDKDIAALLRITHGTVRLHVHHILGKLGVENRVQAVLKAQRLGMLDQ